APTRCTINARTISTFSWDTDLLLQPHGFEGRRSVRVVEDVDDPVVPNRGVRVEANVGRDPAGLAARHYVDRGDHVIASVDHLLQFDSVIVPGVEPLISVLHGCVDPVQAPLVFLERKPLDFW